MIRQKDLWATYQAFHFWSLIGFLPIEFSRTTGKGQVLRSGGRRLLWSFWLLNSLSLTLFKHCRLIQSTFFIQVPFEHLCFTIMKCCTGILDNYWHLSIFYWNPKENEIIFNQLQIQDGGNTRKRKSYSVQEWLIILLSQIFLVGFPTTCAALNYIGPTSPEFLSSILPPIFQNGFTFALLCIHETSTYAFWMCVAAYGTFVQLAFIQDTKDDIQGSVKSLTDGDFIGSFKHLGEECSKLKLTRLGMVLFNKTYSNLIFAQKLYLITVSTMCWYGTVLLFSNNPVQFCIFLYWAVTVSPFFVILYDKGFKIPRLMSSWKSQILIASKRMRFNDNKDVVEKQVESVPNSGIKVGGFNMLERESSPIFLDFVLNKVADLLVSFPRK